MSGSATITLNNTEPAPNGHAATFTADTPNGEASTYTPEPAANDAAPAQNTANATRFNKPIDLIVAEIAHAGGALLFAAERAGRDDNGLPEAIARRMLCDIAHDASIAKVLRALATMGGPSSLDEVTQRLQAARDAATAA